MMMMNLTTLLMSKIGYCKQEGKYEICYLSFFHCYRTKKHFHSKTVSFRKDIKREETAHPTLRDERYLIALAEVYI